MGHEAVQDLLHHLGSRDHPFSAVDAPLDSRARRVLEGVRRADEVHGNVRIDEDHDSLPRYPRSMLASMTSMSAVGYVPRTASLTATATRRGATARLSSRRAARRCLPPPLGHRQAVAPGNAADLGEFRFVEENLQSADS